MYLRFRRLAFPPADFAAFALQIEPRGDIRFVIQIAHDNFPRSRISSAIAWLTIRMNDVAFIPNATSAESRAFRNIATLSRAF